MLSTRSFRALTNIELDPKLADRGVGRTPLIPKEKQLPPGRIHLAAGGAFNPTEAASESLQAVLEALGDAAHAGMLEKKALPDGWTPLMHAVRSGKLSDVEALLALGADVMTRDRESRTRARAPRHTGPIINMRFALLPFCPCPGSCALHDPCGLLVDIAPLLTLSLTLSHVRCACWQATATPPCTRPPSPAPRPRWRRSSAGVPTWRRTTGTAGRRCTRRPTLAGRTCARCSCALAPPMAPAEADRSRQA